MDTFRIIMYIIITIVIVLLVYTKMHNDIKTQIIKINSAESKIDESLRQKYDLLVKAIAEILQIDKDNKDFKNIDTIKNEELSSFEFERKLADIESKIYTFKSENTKINKNISFNDIWYQIVNLNSRILGEEKYYNESTTIYNNLVSKFPTKIVACLLRLKEKMYFDGKDMYDQNIKDFKINEIYHKNLENYIKNEYFKIK